MDGKLRYAKTLANDDMLDYLDSSRGVGSFAHLVVEMVASMGMPVGAFITLGLLLGLANLVSKKA